MEPTLISADSVDAGGLLAASGAYSAILIIVWVVMILALWRIFDKAGEPGWAAIIPIYNVYVLLKIIGRPWWWLILMLIPVINTITWLVIMYDLAKTFGRGLLFALGLIFFPWIWYMILGFGSSEYQGPPPVMKVHG